MSGGGKRWLDDAADPGRRALRRAIDDGAPREDDVARARIWAGVQAPWARPAARRWPLLALAAVGAAAIALGFALRPALRPRGGELALVPAPVGHVALRAEQIARHRLAGGVEAELAAQASLVPGDELTAPEVKQGRVRFSVPHQPPGRRYAVRAGAYRVVVLGTVFDVSVDDTVVGVSVSSGVVQIEDATSGQRLERLAPGESWSSALLPVEPPPPPAVRPPHRAEAPADPGTSRELAEARAARRGGEPQRALALYQELVAAGGPLAESALFEMATIEHEDLHDLGRALSTWQRYRERYPRGLLRAEADLSVIEVLPRLGQEARALDEARAFLRRYPHSERRGEVARVAGDLARAGGDCRAALSLYEAAAAGVLAPSEADDTSFGRAACLSALGDPRAGEAVRAYVARFPSGRHAGEAARLR